MLDKKRGYAKFGMRFLLILMVVVLGPGCGSNTGGGGDGDGGLNNTSDDANINDNSNVNTNDNGNTNDNTNQNTNGGDDGGVEENPCGNDSPHCKEYVFGEDPMPMPGEDPNVDTNGVGRDANGDIVLDSTNMDFNYLWIANTHDAASRGTVSKIDSETVMEVARYYTVTCFGNSEYENGQCLDVAGNPIQIGSNSPSRTAVDYNFDVWVANRAFGGQPSATKIANSTDDCIDRNDNGVIDTSHDWDGDGEIDIDCDNDGQPDDIDSVCANGNPPEFLGHDDECVLHTTNYANTNELGRSVCLDAGDPYEGGAGNAWVGTNSRPGNNRYYKIDGAVGGISETVDLPAGISPYGCAVDGHGILWVSELGGAGAGRSIYFDTADPTNMGSIIQNPWGGHYGLTVDSDQNIWFAGCYTRNVVRYRPDRTTFNTLSQGVWTQVRTAEEGNIVHHTRGMAADLRGWVWAAATAGWIYRIPQSLPDGNHSWADAVAQGAARVNVNLGGGMIGVGIDFSGHVWGMSYNNSTATRVDLDANGDPVDLMNNVHQIPVGTNPYTYSDFTGYGLRNFVRPRGTYRYILEGCAPEDDTNWLRVEWDATTPQGTSVALRVRTGDEITSFGDWFGVWDVSPAILEDPPQGPVWPDPARYIQVEFELSSQDQEDTPILHGFSVVRDCEGTVVE